MEQGNATYLFLKRLDGKIDRLEHKFLDISTNRNNIQTLNEDFLSYFPMKDTTSIDNIEVLITNDIDFKKNVVFILFIYIVINSVNIILYIL